MGKICNEGNLFIAKYKDYVKPENLMYLICAMDSIELMSLLAKTKPELHLINVFLAEVNNNLSSFDDKGAGIIKMRNLLAMFDVESVAMYNWLLNQADIIEPLVTGIVEWEDTSEDIKMIFGVEPSPSYSFKQVCETIMELFNMDETMRLHVMTKDAAKL